MTMPSRRAEKHRPAHFDSEMRGDLRARGALRDTFLQDNGYRVRRIAAADILRDLDAVTTAIVAHAASPFHHSASSNGFALRIGEE